MTSIAGIDIVAVAVLPTAVAVVPAVIATIEQWRILYARLRRALSRWCRGLAQLHSSYSSTSIASIAADAAADVVP